MPRFDGTGPWGLGPGTGWGLGPCGAGRAWRRGGGFGLGWKLIWRRFGGYPYWPPINDEEEEEFLKEEAKYLEEELEAIKARLAELKNKPKNQK